MAYQQSYGLSAQLVSNNLQTNGLLLYEAWARFFREYRFFIGVSLDGPEEDHNYHRYSENGNGGFRGGNGRNPDPQRSAGGLRYPDRG